MNRTDRMNESRKLRAYWMRQARHLSLGPPISECVRKARFHHRNLMAVKLAEWA